MQVQQIKKCPVEPLQMNEIDDLNAEFLADAGTDIDEMFQI